MFQQMTDRDVTQPRIEFVVGCFDIVFGVEYFEDCVVEFQFLLLDQLQNRDRGDRL